MKINVFQDPEAGLKMMSPLFAICTLLGTLEVVAGLIDTSKYKILFDHKKGTANYWDRKCKGEMNSKMFSVSLLNV